MSSTTESPRPDDIAEAMAYVVVTVAVLSCLGSTFIIVTYFIWPELRTASRQLLVFLSLADYANAAGNGCGAVVTVKKYDYSSTGCKLQSFVTTWSSMALFGWTVAMAVYLYVAIVRNSVKRAKRLVPLFHIICWGLPTVITANAFYWDALGNSQSFVSVGWCWVSRRPPVPSFSDDASFAKARLFWMLVTGKIWEISACVATPLLYFLIKRHIHKEALSGDQFFTSSIRSAASKVDRKLVLIPAVFVLLRVWGTTRFLIDVIGNPRSSQNYPALIYLQAIGDTGQGFANVIIFCWFTSRIRVRIVSCCLFCNSCEKPTPSKPAHTGETQNVGNPSQVVHHDGEKFPEQDERCALLNASTRSGTSA